MTCVQSLQLLSFHQQLCSCAFEGKVHLHEKENFGAGWENERREPQRNSVHLYSLRTAETDQVCAEHCESRLEMKLSQPQTILSVCQKSVHPDSLHFACPPNPDKTSCCVPQNKQIVVCLFFDIRGENYEVSVPVINLVDCTERANVVIFACCGSSWRNVLPYCLHHFHNDGSAVLLQTSLNTVWRHQPS